jgi:hypothetical protein
MFTIFTDIRWCSLQIVRKKFRLKRYENVADIEATMYIEPKFYI